MLNRSTIMLCVAILLLSSAIPLAARGKASQQADASSSQEDFVALQKAFIAAQERGDAEYVKNAVAKDFTGIETNGDITDRAEFVHVEAPEKPERSPILYDFHVIQLNDDCVIVTYNAVFPGSQLDRYQHVSDTWVNEDDHWKLKFQQGTLNLWSAHDLD
jgi:hypothetical protein